MCAKIIRLMATFIVLLLGIGFRELYVDCFNVDVRHPILFSDAPGSLFGFSVQLMRNSDGHYMLLAGAPAGNSSYDSSFQPGVVFACRIGQDKCRELYYTHSDSLITDPDFNYVELKNGSWLGVAIDVAQDESQFVACGHLWKNMIHLQDYLVNGICYVHNADLNIGAVHVLMPLINRQLQVIDKQYVYALGLAGMSAHFASDATNLLIGAPGAQQLAGSVISLPLTSLEPVRGRRRPNFNIPVPSDIMSEDSYFGYAITSGKFYTDKLVYYVGGAPREGVNGKAFIYQMGEVQNDEVIIKNTINGAQMGEYFGSSLCAVDVNNDSLTDLLIGAPLHSIEGDEGRVYVYLSDGNFLHLSNELLIGSGVIGSRFGTAMAAVGDVNLDGFQDVAIGAPYEANGAVYIYHGGPDGLASKEAQRILSADINTGLRGFGISISKGKDIDGNSYPDFAVGAFASSNVVILRTRPIIKVSGTLSSDTKHINPKNKTCAEGVRSVACLTLEVCAYYVGQRSPNTVDLEVVVENDVYKKDDFQLPRVYFFDNVEGQMANLNFVASLSKGKADCRRFPVHVQNDIYDFLSPVEFRMSMKLRDDMSVTQKTFCKECPVIDNLTSSNVTTQLNFLTGCKEERCISDLKVSANFVEYSPGEVMVLGASDILQLQVKVTNVGDPAFQTVLRVVFPPEIDFSRIPSECSSYIDGVSVALFCSLGNPLEANKQVELKIGADMKVLSSDTKELMFNLSVTTVSDEIDETKADNILLLTLPIKSVADLSVKGWQVNEEEIFFNRSNPDAFYVTHIYEINKYEPSPVKDAMLEIRFPISTTNQVSFFNKPITIDVYYNYMPINNKCQPKVVDPTISAVRHVDSEYGVAAVLDCNSMMCHVVNCHIGPFVKQDVATVNITALVDLPVLITLAGESQIFQVRSSASVRIIDEHVVRPSAARPNEAVVVTAFLPQDLTLRGSGLPTWVIPLAIIFGLLLLAAIAYVMYRFGFFRRKIKEDMMHSGLTETAISDDELPTTHEAATLNGS